MPPLRGLLLLRRVQTSSIDGRATANPAIKKALDRRGGQPRYEALSHPTDARAASADPDMCIREK
jgi:hypothetical protein